VTVHSQWSLSHHDISLSRHSTLGIASKILASETRMVEWPEKENYKNDNSAAVGLARRALRD
jgi:hypothetical protein